MTIYNSLGEQIIDVIVDDKSYRYKVIMGENSLTLYFSLSTFIDIPEGSYIDFKAERYILLDPENFTQHHSENYEYTLLLDSYQSLLKNIKFKFFTMADGVVNSPFELKFSLTLTPTGFAQLLVDNMNIGDSTGDWTVGDCIDADPVCLDFNHEYCFDVLSKLVAKEAFDTEWEFENKILHIRPVEKLKDSPIPLKYGYNCGLIPGTSRVNVSTSKAITRLFIEGSNRNIDKSVYGSSTLRMPKNQIITYKGIDYKTDSSGTFIERVISTGRVVEDSLDVTKIYPSRIGIVSQVNTVDVEKNLYDIIDSSIPDELDFSKEIISGETMTIIFQTGQLAGKEFNVAYKAPTKRFEIVPTSDNGINYPCESIFPEIGDKYAVFHVSLPTNYITSSEIDVLNAAVKYLYENESQKYTYTGTLDEIYAKRNWLTIGGFLNCGYFVSLQDDQFLNIPVVIRITAVKEFINKPKQPEITLSNEVTGETLGTVLKTIPTQIQATDRKDLEVTRNARRQWADVKQTTEMLQNSLLNYSESISPISIKTMQLIAGDESLQFRFVDSMINPISVIHNVTYDPLNKKLTAPEGILQHMTLGINTVSSVHAVSEYKFWALPAYISPVLTELDMSYYLYAKCSKTETTGIFLLSETSIALEGIEGYYHLLVGILNSENDGDRSYAKMYGFTEILPGRITTDKIVSSDGNTYFDLINNIIAGKINFKDGLISSMIALASGQDITAGLQGDSNVNVGMWLGGTYQDALDGIAKSIDYKDGSARKANGNLNWDKDGNVVLKGIITALGGKIGGLGIFNNTLMSDSMEFTENPIDSLGVLTTPEIQTIERQEIWSSGLVTADEITHEVHAVANTQTFTFEHSSSIDVRIRFTNQYANNGSRMQFSVKIIDSLGNIVYSDNLNGDLGAIPSFEFTKILPQGTYYIEAKQDIINNINCPNLNGSVSIFGKRQLPDISGYYWDDANIFATGYVFKTKIGNNGLFSFWNNYQYLYFSSIYGFEVLWGSSLATAKGIQITDSGIKKWNGTEWVSENWFGNLPLISTMHNPQNDGRSVYFSVYDGKLYRDN